MAEILDRQEYVGDTVNFRTYRQSFKLKKQLDRPLEDWKVFPNTHPAIIDRETFALVQNLGRHRRRPDRTGLQRLLWYVQVYEKRFAQEQMERFGLQEKRR